MPVYVNIKVIKDFNPRSRVGNDDVEKMSLQSCAISIHVPAWGTTTQSIEWLTYAFISIHVPAWGTTRYNRSYDYHNQDFNPRSRVGNDLFFLWWLKEPFRFQSTFPRGERLWYRVLIFFALEFQSTFPRGERRTFLCKGYYVLRNFNPRSRVGNDHYDLEITVERSNFNPRSRVGNDCIHQNKSLSRPISIHVPAWGTTTFLEFSKKAIKYFNPRSRVGNDINQ